MYSILLFIRNFQVSFAFQFQPKRYIHEIPLQRCFLSYYFLSPFLCFQVNNAGSCVSRHICVYVPWSQLYCTRGTLYGVPVFVQCEYRAPTKGAPILCVPTDTTAAAATAYQPPPPASSFK